jgi:hypothetical protein
MSSNSGIADSEPGQGRFVIVTEPFHHYLQVPERWATRPDASQVDLRGKAGLVGRLGIPAQGISNQRLGITATFGILQVDPRVAGDDPRLELPDCNHALTR